VKSPYLSILVANKTDIPDDTRVLHLASMTDLEANDSYFSGIEIIACCSGTGKGISNIATSILRATAPATTSETRLEQLTLASEQLQADAFRFEGKA
jgi:hypothetical protein